MGAPEVEPEISPSVVSSDAPPVEIVKTRMPCAAQTRHHRLRRLALGIHAVGDQKRGLVQAPAWPPKMSDVEVNARPIAVFPPAAIASTAASSAGRLAAFTS